MKYREFWVQDTAAPTYTATTVSVYDEEANPSIIDEWHVIEHAALTDALAMCEKLDEALRNLYRLAGDQVSFAYSKECKVALEKYRKFKEGMK